MCEELAIASKHFITHPLDVQALDCILQKLSPENFKTANIRKILVRVIAFITNEIPQYLALFMKIESIIIEHHENLASYLALAVRSLTCVTHMKWPINKKINNFYLLSYAYIDNNKEVIQYLIDHGAIVDKTDPIIFARTIPVKKFFAIGNSSDKILRRALPNLNNQTVIIPAPTTPPLLPVTTDVLPLPTTDTLPLLTAPSQQYPKIVNGVPNILGSCVITESYTSNSSKCTLHKIDKIDENGHPLLIKIKSIPSVHEHYDTSDYETVLGVCAIMNELYYLCIVCNMPDLHNWFEYGIYEYKNCSYVWFVEKYGQPIHISSDTYEKIYCDIRQDLAIMHSLGIAHHDIKHTNMIMFANNSDPGSVMYKLIDFENIVNVTEKEKWYKNNPQSIELSSHEFWYYIYWGIWHDFDNPVAIFGDELFNQDISRLELTLFNELHFLLPYQYMMQNMLKETQQHHINREEYDLIRLQWEKDMKNENFNNFCAHLRSIVQ